MKMDIKNGRAIGTMEKKTELRLIGMKVARRKKKQFSSLGKKFLRRNGMKMVLQGN